MPDGLTHAKYHKAFLPVVALWAAAGVLYGYGLRNPFVQETSLWFFVWYLAGRWIDPDWDQQGLTAAEGRIQRELLLISPPLLAATAFYSSTIYVLVKLFRIKGAIGGTHRTWLTHSIIPGTLTRMLVICLGLGFVVNYATFLTRTILGTVVELQIHHIYPFLLGMFLGLGNSDLIHIILDKLYGGE